MFLKGIHVHAILAFTVLAALQPLAETKFIGKCVLMRTLYRYGVPYHELADWMCLVEGESSYNTKATNPSNADGSVDWGLFQINDRYWCKPADGRPSTDSCRLPCRLLLSDDIRYSIACAKYIRRVQASRRGSPGITVVRARNPAYGIASGAGCQILGDLKVMKVNFCYKKCFE